MIFHVVVLVVVVVVDVVVVDVVVAGSVIATAVVNQQQFEQHCSWQLSSARNVVAGASPIVMSPNRSNAGVAGCCWLLGTHLLLLGLNAPTYCNTR